MKKQRGALTFITPIIMVVIIMLGVLAMDGARLYSVRQEMQSQVNAAATAAAQATQACGSLSFNETASDRAYRGAVQGGFKGEESELDVSIGKVISEAGVLKFLASDAYQESNAVFVSYKKSEPISALLPSTIFGTVDMSVSAVAKKSVTATFSASAITAIVGGGGEDLTILNGLLGLLLNGGEPYALSALELSEINDLTVKLDDLLVDTGAGAVLGALPVDARALADVLKGTVGAGHPAAVLLDDLLRTAGADLGNVEIESVLELLGEEAVVSPDARIPVYDLLISMAMNVLEGTLTDPLELGIVLNGLAKVEVSLWVTEAPKVVVGEALLTTDGNPQNIEDWETSFRSSNIKLFLNVNLLDDPLLGALANISLPLVVEAGNGQGAFASAKCAQGAKDNRVDLGVDWSTSVASIRTAKLLSDGSEVPADLSVSIVPVLVPINVPLRLDIDVVSEGGAPSPVIFEGVDLHKTGDGFSPKQKSVGGNISGLDVDLSAGSKGLLGAVLSILNPLLDLVNTLVLEPLVRLVISPLLDILGLDAGSMNIRVTDAHQKIVLLEGVEVE
ncbi:MAG: hypothetical protein CL549_14885 [Alcanivorax sp.]|nr:hypothetical protein [Alcanivorax sp.]